MERMNIDRAVRLRELWNGSFGLTLLIEEKSRNNFALRIAKNEISASSVAILARLTESLHLEFRADYDKYTII